MKPTKSITGSLLSLVMSIVCIVSLSSCSDMYYGIMEQVGLSKRDILVKRVEKTQVAQNEAQEEFKSALDLFASVVNIDNSKLKDTYKKINAEYEECLSASNAVSQRIKQVESVSNDLFKEWANELDMYQNQSLQLTSQQRLQDARQKYNEMLASMHQAAENMTLVLYTFRDTVLFLKHNLNAQAIGALKNEFSILKVEIDRLIRKMNSSIQTSNTFIEELKNSNR